jgi:hypothetical protein
MEKARKQATLKLFLVSKQFIESPFVNPCIIKRKLNPRLYL